MKKLILLLSLFLTFNCAFAQNEVAFIYINGSNNNDTKMKKWFFDGIQKFHPILKKTVEKDPEVIEEILEKGSLKIKEQPNTLFWGDLSQNQLATLKADLKVMDVLSPKFAQLVRKIFALSIHDAIWVSKANNMYPVIEMLHKEVMEEYQKGNRAVLLGYSAGTFVTYQYYLTKLPYISQSDFLDLVKTNNNNLNHLKTHPIQNTCLDALFLAELMDYNVSGGFVSTDNLDVFKDGVKNLPSMTEKYCAPKGSIKGVINYASPLVLFFSDPSDPNFPMSKVMKSFLKYVVEEDMFWLTVNYANDPMGFPTYNNLTGNQIEAVTETRFNPKAGFLYDKSDKNSSRPFFVAHTSYWSTSKRFAKLVLKGYKDGRANFLK